MFLQVNDEECFVWARRLAKRRRTFYVGGSGGGCISATLRLAKTCKKGDLIVAFLPDTGSRYLSKIYNDSWMREHGYADSEVTLTASDVIRVKHQNGKTREPIIVGPNQTVFHALKTMQLQDISQLPVFEGDQSIGTVFEDQILNLCASRKRSSKAHRSGSDGRRHAAGTLQRSRGTPHLHTHTRQSGHFCGNGFGEA